MKIMHGFTMQHANHPIFTSTNSNMHGTCYPIYFTCNPLFMSTWSHAWHMQPEHMQPLRPCIRLFSIDNKCIYLLSLLYLLNKMSTVHYKEVMSFYLISFDPSSGAQDNSLACFGEDIDVVSPSVQCIHVALPQSSHDHMACIHIYIYIYIERERERERVIIR